MQDLFLSVGWVLDQYPDWLHKALLNSSTVFTAWDDSRLMGPCAFAGRQRNACLYALRVGVYQDYQGQVIAGKLMEMVKEKYKDYPYIEIMPEESRNAVFYQKHGFELMKDGVEMQLCNFSDRR